MGLGSWGEVGVGLGTGTGAGGRDLKAMMISPKMDPCVDSVEGVALVATMSERTLSISCWWKWMALIQARA